MTVAWRIIDNSTGKTLFEGRRGIGDPRDASSVAAIVGPNAVLAPDGTEKERHDQLKAGVTDPEPGLTPPSAGVPGAEAPNPPGVTSEPAAGSVKSALRAKEKSPYAVEVRVGGQPRVPEVRDGLVFVPIRQGEAYSIILNNDSDLDAAVALMIDGLSVFFSESRTPAGTPYDHYVVPAHRTLEIKGWHRNNKKADQIKVGSYSESVHGQLLQGSATPTSARLPPPSAPPGPRTRSRRPTSRPVAAPPRPPAAAPRSIRNFARSAGSSA